MVSRFTVLSRTLSRCCPPYGVRYFSQTSARRVQKDYSASYLPDEWTNVTAAVLDKVPRRLFLQPRHPIGILRGLIHRHLTHGYSELDAPSPIVTVAKNFDELGFAEDHPGRSKSDSYYFNRTHMLRTHTSAHEIEIFRRGLERWILTADVYRRDAIDYSHYPVFHQMEGSDVLPKERVSEFEGRTAELNRSLASKNVVIKDDTIIGPSNPIQEAHTPEQATLAVDNLKATLNSLLVGLFGNLKHINASGETSSVSSEPLQIRWIEAFFPWTSPSYEVEVLWNGKWLEMLGCGIVRQDTLDRSGVGHKMGWAFGLGLERIAMLLYGIPDIRLFWSTDRRFLDQFQSGGIQPFKPYSRYPPCYKDLSFWTPPTFHENDFADSIRNVAGDLVEDVALLDSFVHPKTKRVSLCYRINYRSMDRNLVNEEINSLHDQVIADLVPRLGLEIR